MAKEKENQDLESLIVGSSFFMRKPKYLKTNIHQVDMFFSGSGEVGSDEGFLAGKMYAISGASGIGKSTMTMEFAKQWCKQGYRGVAIDVENGYDMNTLKSVGLDEFTAMNQDDPSKALSDFIKEKKNFLVVNPQTYGLAAKILHKLANETKMDFFIIDSVKALTPTYLEENIDSIEQLPMGIAARNQENFLPFLKNHICAPKNICGILINQLRTKLTSYGGFPAEPSNHAWQFYPDMRFVVKKAKDGEISLKYFNSDGEKFDKQIGNWVDIIVSKGRGNKYSFLKVPVIFGRGISVVYIYKNILEQSGLIPIPERSNSKIDLSALKTAISEAGDTSKIPDTVTGFAGVIEMIKENVAVIDAYVVAKNLLFVEREVE